MRDFLDRLSLLLGYTNILKNRVNLHRQQYHGCINHSIEYDYDFLQDNLPKGKQKNCDYNMAN